MTSDRNYLPLLQKILRESEVYCGLDVVEESRPNSVCLFYKVQERFQGEAMTLLGIIEITACEQHLHRASSLAVDGFLRLKLEKLESSLHD